MAKSIPAETGQVLRAQPSGVWKLEPGEPREEVDLGQGKLEKGGI